MSKKKSQKIQKQKQQKPEQDTIYTWEEVGKHNQKDNLWVVIDDTVYDVTSFVEDHPGGVKPLVQNAGKNASKAFNHVGHSKNAKEKVLPKYKIGEIDPKSQIVAWQKGQVSAAKQILTTFVLSIMIIGSLVHLAL